MAILPLIMGPDPLLKTKAEPVLHITDEVRTHIADMFDTLYEHNAVGIGANMVGLTKQLIVIDLQEGGTKKPQAFINPEIIWASTSLSENEEASLCFPGISAKIKRPDAIKLTYMNEAGDTIEESAEGWLAIVIQHEMDYLEGKSYLDYLSKMQRERLIKKMQKQIKHHHCHDPHCCPDH